jgi:hypothetical protein
MADFVLWSSRENYQRFREIMDDGRKLPPTFDGWEKNAKRQVAHAKKHGIIIKPVPFDADKFMALCRERHLTCSGEARAVYAVTFGLATARRDRLAN